MLTEEEKAERRKGIGGSDIPSLFNVGFGCCRRLYYDKKGMAPDYTFFSSPDIDRGNYLEAIAARYYMEQMPYATLGEHAVIVCKMYPWSRCNPDRILYIDDVVAMCEIKVRGSDKAHRI
jgi:hypothetical protein